MVGLKKGLGSVCEGEVLSLHLRRARGEDEIRVLLAFQRRRRRRGGDDGERLATVGARFS